MKRRKRLTATGLRFVRNTSLDGEQILTLAQRKRMTDWTLHVETRDAVFVFRVPLAHASSLDSIEEFENEGVNAGAELEPDWLGQMPKYLTDQAQRRAARMAELEQDCDEDPEEA